jgi:hypothetical protein
VIVHVRCRVQSEPQPRPSAMSPNDPKQTLDRRPRSKLLQFRLFKAKTLGRANCEILLSADTVIE